MYYLIVSGGQLLEWWFESIYISENDTGRLIVMYGHICLIWMFKDIFILIWNFVEATLSMMKFWNCRTGSRHRDTKLVNCILHGVRADGKMRSILPLNDQTLDRDKKSHLKFQKRNRWPTKKIGCSIFRHSLMTS